MTHLTYYNYLSLDAWSLLDEYEQHRDALVAIARLVYAATARLLDRDPTPSDCEEPLQAALRASEIWQRILNNKQPSPLSYPMFTQAMVRYLLDQEWDDIRPRAAAEDR